MKKRRTEPNALGCCRLVPYVLMLSLFAGTLQAAEIRSVVMERTGKHYQVVAVTWLAADPEFVIAVLLDYDEFHRLSSGISESRWLPETDEHQPLAYTRIDSCVAFFCRRLEKVERVMVSGPLTFATEILAERSDFTRFSATWQLRPGDGGTVIRYELHMQPDFWVPPLIGPWAIRRKAESSALEIAERIEFLFGANLPLQEFDLEAYRRRN